MEKSSCCKKDNKGITKGFLYGIIPHSFCILFIFFSIIGATGASLFAKRILLIPNLFLILIITSLSFATLSAFIYLKKNDCCSLKKIKYRWKYITTLYTITVLTNLIFIFFIFPVVVNAQTIKTTNINDNESSIIYVDVNIPCTGHAPIIIDEIRKNQGINYTRFKMPSTFEISFDPKQISIKDIKSLEIFKTFNLKISN